MFQFYLTNHLSDKLWANFLLAARCNATLRGALIHQTVAYVRDELVMSSARTWRCGHAAHLETTRPPGWSHKPVVAPTTHGGGCTVQPFAPKVGTEVAPPSPSRTSTSCVAGLN